MPLYELTPDELTPLSRTTMAQQNITERGDLQRLLRKSIEVIDADLLVIAEEFSHFEDSRRRIDLLAIDKRAQLVIIELKRSEDGGFMDLQAVRYAAMISTMTFLRAVEIYAEFLAESGDARDPKTVLLQFLGSDTPQESFGNRVRIVLVSPDFGKELTTSVLWLNESGLDIRCVRLRPYLLQGRIILDAEQIIPLPEAEDFMIGVKEKQEESRQATETKWSADFSRYDLTVQDKVFPNLWKRGLVWQVVRSAIDLGIDFAWLKALLTPYRLFEVAGELSAEQFIEAAALARTPTGAGFAAERFFTGEKQLIRHQGRTYALSNQWSIASFPLLNEIIAQLPAGAIVYAKSESV